MASTLALTLSHFMFCVIWPAVALVVKDNVRIVDCGAMTREDDYLVDVLLCALGCVDILFGNVAVAAEG